MKWTDSRDIAIALQEKYQIRSAGPALRRLRNWGLELPGFDESETQRGKNT